VSLLRRIEKGQGGGNQGGGSQGGQGGNQGGGGDDGRTDSMRRRVPMPTGAAGGAAKDNYVDLKVRVQTKLLSELDPTMDTRSPEVRATIEELFSNILAEENIVLSRAEKARLFDQIVAEILGFGPLELLLADETVTEIMVNGPKNIYVERKGKIVRVPVTFEGNDHVMRVIDRIVAPLGRRIDESSPYVDARLPDGSRVNAVIPPISLVGPVLTIRKFSKSPVTIDQLVQFGSMTAEQLSF